VCSEVGVPTSTYVVVYCSVIVLKQLILDIKFRISNFVASLQLFYKRRFKFRLHEQKLGEYVMSCYLKNEIRSEL